MYSIRFKWSHKYANKQRHTTCMHERNIQHTTRHIYTTSDYLTSLPSIHTRSRLNTCRRLSLGSLGPSQGFVLCCVRFASGAVIPTHPCCTTSSFHTPKQLLLLVSTLEISGASVLLNRFLLLIISYYNMHVFHLFLHGPTAVSAVLHFLSSESHF